MQRNSVRRGLVPALAAAGVVSALLMTPAVAGTGTTATVVYDNFNGPYSLATYNTKWANPYGLGDMAAGPDTRKFTGNVFQINDAPFRTSFDFSVYDHLKYLATSKQSFDVPAAGGSITFSSQINAQTPGTQTGRFTQGTYGPPGSYPNGTAYQSQQALFEGQQAGAVMNMIDFQTGQLFDWFISGSRAFALVERLPSSVSGNTTDTSSPDYVGPGKMYTQIAWEGPAKPGMHTVAITYTRDSGGTTASVTFTLDGKVVFSADHVGMPLDSPLRTNGPPWTGVYSSATYPGGPLASGEDLGSKISSFTIGHGTFSLLDAFPYQWGWDTGCDFPLETLFSDTCTQGSVSIPTTERLFGQGAKATFDNFTVTTTTP